MTIQEKRIDAAKELVAEIEKLGKYRMRLNKTDFTLWSNGSPREDRYLEQEQRILAAKEKLIRICDEEARDAING